MTSLYSCGDDKLTQREPVRTLWLPPLHPYGVHTLAAALRCLGRPAQALPTENVETFEIAKRYCRGTECVPLPSTIGAFLHVLKNSDAPERECLFMPSAKGPCRFGQYHTLQRMVLDAAGYRDTPIESWSDANGRYGHGVREGRAMYNAILAGDLLYKARCRIRPYARDRAAFDSLMKDVFASAIRVIEQGGDVKQMLGLSAARLSAVDRANDRRPLVGIVGEIYVRSNVFTNGNLIEVIEDAGGEAWLAPVSEWFQYLSYLDRMMAGERQEPVASKIKLNLKNFYLTRQESSLAGAMSAVIGDRREPPIKSTLEAGMRVFPKQFDGESIMTVGRAIEFAENGADLIINCAPFGCMPGTLTAGIFQKLEGRLKVPVMSLFFDGEADIEAPVRTYLANLVKAD